jgi:hypothetical protein
MTGPKSVSLINDEAGMFVVVDGVRVAQRGYPGTPQEGTWVSLEPGWEVLEDEDFRSIHIR